MSEVTNTPLLRDGKAWAQATLPIRVGGLGVRSASVSAPSAYLSSSAATAEPSTTLPATHQSLPVPSRDVALEIWSESHSEEPPGEVLRKRETGTASRWVWQLSPCWLRLLRR